ncbi:inositol hexakisphosphate and diphosphoinositol-pentakisphosphate kinase 2 [Plakobranchus ocellatus]|uniref:Inositol hexakisphosphate and diphosphoinositol-pentakisphosphate kinase 2 n=1 Tax=Plakobranchus ocellatus TaxID=259542 RepID=A0AAV3YHU0_9GAST|nr:inositol hexakisphosphate and diphosphoinositol-pentakisphosphate kinase 2 [Plakobranchus ocellatus]
MGSFDDAETCKLVGLYLLSQLQNLDINVSLYRDDGLAVTTKSAREAESIKKKIFKIFKGNGLNITIEVNNKTKKKPADFLDILLDLRMGTYKLYKNLNTNINYINKESNHPPSVTRNLTKSRAIRLSNNSSNAESFQQAAEKYQEALACSGYKQQLVYTPTYKTLTRAGASRANTTSRPTAKGEKRPTQLITKKNPAAAKCICEGTALG